MTTPPTDEERAELLALADRMRTVSSRTYDLFFRAGMGGEVHAFIEFCGVLSKYVDICERCAQQGIDFRHLNTHSGRGLPVFEHDMAYLGEKLDCIFGPAIQSNPAARRTLHDAIFGATPAPDPGTGDALSRTLGMARELEADGYHVMVRDAEGRVLDLATGAPEGAR